LRSRRAAGRAGAGPLRVRTPCRPICGNSRHCAGCRG
jgi:hypothetical protein